MRITIPVTIEVGFDLECDGETHNEDQIDPAVVRHAVTSVLHTDTVTDGIIDAISEETGWCVGSFTITTEE
jgi:hypothetical protein